MCGTAYSPEHDAIFVFIVCRGGILNPRKGLNTTGVHVVAISNNIGCVVQRHSSA